MTWRYTKDGREISRPSAEHGIHIDGPISSEDLRHVIGELLNELVDLVKREGSREGRQEAFEEIGPRE